MICNENRNLSALLKDRIIAGIPQHRHNIRWDEMFSGFAVVISCKNCDKYPKMVVKHSFHTIVYENLKNKNLIKSKLQYFRTDLIPL